MLLFELEFLTFWLTLAYSVIVIYANCDITLIDILILFFRYISSCSSMTSYNDRNIMNDFFVSKLMVSARCLSNFLKTPFLLLIALGKSLKYLQILLVRLQQSHDFSVL